MDGENPLEKERMLEAVGVSEAEERAYATLLVRPGSSLAELARLLDMPRPQAQRNLEALQRKGLVSVSPEKVHRYLPAPPDLAVEALILKRQEEIQRARLAANRLVELARGARSRRESVDRLVEIVTGREAMFQRLEQMVRAARHEVISLERPPYLSNTYEEVDTESTGEMEAMRRPCAEE